MLDPKEEEIQAPLLDTPDEGKTFYTLPPANPAERITELTFAEKYLSENPEFNEQLTAITKIEEMQSRGHMPMYYELYSREVEERTASIVENASSLYKEGYQELSRHMMEGALTKRELAKRGTVSDNDVYETVAQMTLTQAFVEAQEEDPFLDSEVFSAELIAQAAKDRRDANTLEDAFQEIMIKMQEEHGDAWFGKRWNSYEQIAAFGLFLRQLDGPQQLRILEDVSKRAFGFLGVSHNPKSTIDFFNKLQSYSLGDAALANAMTILDYSIVADLGLLVKPLYMLGKTAALTAKIAGATRAGRVLGQQSVNGNILTPGAKNNLDKIRTPDMDSTFEQKGVSEGLRQELNADGQRFLDDYQATLVSQGVPEPTISMMIKNLSESTLSPETLKSLRGVILGDPILGTPGDVLWHAPNGRSFPSRQAANDWAARQGFKEFEVLEPRLVENQIPLGQRMVDAALEAADSNAAKMAIIENLDKLDKLVKRQAPEGQVNEMVDQTIGEILEEMEGVKTKAMVQAKALEAYTGKSAVDNVIAIEEEMKKLQSRLWQATQAGDDKMVEEIAKAMATANRNLQDMLLDMNRIKHDSVERTLRYFGGWEKGSGLRMSARLEKNTRLAGALKSIHSKYGLGDLVVYTSKEADDLGLAMQTTSGSWGKALNEPNFRGHKNVTMVVIDDSVSLAQQAKTLAHEMGHIFDYQYLTAKNPQAVSKILGAFNEWYEGLKKSRGNSFKARFASRQGPSSGKKVRNVAKESINFEEFQRKMLERGARGEKVLAWQEDFKEWWADQFAKHAFTNPTVSTEIGKYFSATVKRIGEVYRALGKALGLGDTPAFKNPVKAVRTILDEHVELIRKGEIDLPLKATIDIDMDFTKGKGELRAMDNGQIPQRSPEEVSRLIDEVEMAARAQATDDHRDTQGFIVRTPETSQAPRYNEADFEGLDYAPATRGLTDPRSSIVPELFKAGVIKEYGEERLLELFRRYQASTLPSNKKELAAVERHLARGDAFSDSRYGRGKIFTVDELFRSGDLVNDAVIKGYYGMVQMRKLMHQIHNNTIVKELRARGFVEYRAKKPVRSPDIEVETDLIFHAAPVHAIDDLLGARIYDVKSSTAIEGSQDLFDRMRREGGRIVRLRRPQYLSRDGVRDEYALIFDDDIGSDFVKVEPIQQALGYRPGEIARYYTDPFFIDMEVLNKTTRTGKNHKLTIRTAPDVLSAKKYVDDMNEALALLRAWRNGVPQSGNIVRQLSDIIGAHSDAEDFFRAFREGDFDDTVAFQFRHDRQSKDDLISALDLSQPGGVLRSKRKGKVHGFDFQVDPGRENAAQPMQSLLQEARTVTRFASTHELRSSQVEKFINTFGDLFPEQIVPEDPWLTWDRIKDVDLSTVGTRKALIADNARRYLREHLGILDKEELTFVNSTVDRMTRWQLDYGMHGAGGGSRLKKVIADQVLKLQSKGVTPINWLRAINFNFMLGMWNPAQTFVQAQGAVTALAISPKNGFKAWNRAVAYRFAASALDNDGVLAKIGESLSKAGSIHTGVSPQELREIVTLMKDSGILSNMATSAFHNTDTLSKLRTKPGDGNLYHRFFYNRGEEFTRITAWETARLDWIAKNPDVNWKSKAAQREILEMADNYMLNMNKSNRAAWQKGLFSIPLQFLQWNIKFHNQLVRGIAGGRSNFTRPQALRLLAAHYLAYGTRGNAFGNFIEAAAPEDWFDQDDGWDDERKLAVTQGAFALAIKQMVEVFSGDDTFNPALGSRLGTTRWLQDIIESLADGGSPFIKTALGPSGNVLSNTAKLATSAAEAGVHTVAASNDRLGQIVSMFYPGNDTPSYKNAFTDKSYVLSQWMDVIEDLASVTSGLSNMSKAYMWHQMKGYAINAQGKKVANITDQEIWGKAIFGANPQSVEDTWVLYRNEKEHRKVMQDYAKRIAELQDNEMRARIAGNSKLADQYDRRWRSFYSSLEIDDQWAVRDHLINVYGPSNTLRGKLLIDYFFRTDKYEVGIQSDNLE
jgi:hypothetical protein